MKTAMRREKIAEAFHREISLSKIMSMSICYDLKLNLFKKIDPISTRIQICKDMISV